MVKDVCDTNFLFKNGELKETQPFGVQKGTYQMNPILQYFERLYTKQGFDSFVYAAEAYDKIGPLSVESWPWGPRKTEVLVLIDYDLRTHVKKGRIYDLKKLEYGAEFILRSFGDPASLIHWIKHEHMKIIGANTQ